MEKSLTELAAPSLPCEYSAKTPAGYALTLIGELREEKKISSADRAALAAVIEPVAFAECAAMLARAPAA